MLSSRRTIFRVSTGPPLTHATVHRRSQAFRPRVGTLVAPTTVMSMKEAKSALMTAFTSPSRNVATEVDRPEGKTKGGPSPPFFQRTQRCDFSEEKRPKFLRSDAAAYS